MKWVLILWIMSYKAGGGAPTTAEFNSETDCRNAGRYVKSQWTGTEYLCVPQGEAAPPVPQGK